MLAAVTVGLAKSGFGGMGMLTVSLMAILMQGHERESTGVVLPLLIVGDLLAVQAYRRDVRWELLGKMLPPAMGGIVIGYLCMGHLGNGAFKQVIGSIVVVLVVIQFLKRFGKGESLEPLGPVKPAVSGGGSHWYPWGMGLGAGVVTMLANAAGPVTTLYFLSMRLPKTDFVATTAWFFLVVNLAKVPFSANLGLLQGQTVVFTVVLAPAVALGFFAGHFCLKRINQRLFEDFLLGLTGLAALHLIFS